MNQQKIVDVVKSLEPGDLIGVTRRACGNRIVFLQIVESVNPTSNGYELVYIAGFTPGIGNGPIYRDHFKNISLATNIKEGLNIQAITLISRGNEIPEYKEDFTKSRYSQYSSSFLKGNPGYDLMM